MKTLDELFIDRHGCGYEDYEENLTWGDLEWAFSLGKKSTLKKD